MVLTFTETLDIYKAKVVLQQPPGHIFLPTYHQHHRCE